MHVALHWYVCGTSNTRIQTWLYLYKTAVTFDHFVPSSPLRSFVRSKRFSCSPTLLLCARIHSSLTRVSAVYPFDDDLRRGSPTSTTRKDQATTATVLQNEKKRKKRKALPDSCPSLAFFLSPFFTFSCFSMMFWSLVCIFSKEKADLWLRVCVPRSCR